MHRHRSRIWSATGSERPLLRPKHKRSLEPSGFLEFEPDDASDTFHSDGLSGGSVSKSSYTPLACRFTNSAPGPSHPVFRWDRAGPTLSGSIPYRNGNHHLPKFLRPSNPIDPTVFGPGLEETVAFERIYHSSRSPNTMAMVKVLGCR